MLGINLADENLIFFSLFFAKFLIDFFSDLKLMDSSNILILKKSIFFSIFLISGVLWTVWFTYEFNLFWFSKQINFFIFHKKIIIRRKYL